MPSPDRYAIAGIVKPPVLPAAKGAKHPGERANHRSPGKGEPSPAEANGLG